MRCPENGRPAAGQQQFCAVIDSVSDVTGHTHSTACLRKLDAGDAQPRQLCVFQRLLEDFLITLLRQGVKMERNV